MNTTTDAADRAMDALEDEAPGHAFEVGDTVTIYNQRLTGEPRIEGRAEILQVQDDDDTYMVAFEGTDEGEFERVAIAGEAQTDPAAFLERAIADWEARSGQTRAVPPEAIESAAAAQAMVDQASAAPTEADYPMPEGHVWASDTAGNRVQVSAKEACLVNGTLYPNKTRANEARRLATAAAEAIKAGGPTPPTASAATGKAKPAKAKASPKASTAAAPAKAKKKGGLHPAIKSVTSSDHKTTEIKADPKTEAAKATAKRALERDVKDAAQGEAPAPAKVEPAPVMPKAAAKQERTGTKQEQVTAMLCRPEGATVAQIAAVTGWQAHSSRGFIAGNMKKRGYTISTQKVDGATVYKARAPE